MIARLQGFQLSILVVLSTVLLTPLQLHAAESTRNGEWFCERSESDGRWSCHREGAADATATSPSSPAPIPSATEQRAAEQREAEQIAAEQRVADQQPQEVAQAIEQVVEEEVAPVQAAIDEVPASVDNVAEELEQSASTVAQTEPAPVREAPPAPAPAYDPVQSGAFDDRPDYQRLAYVPDQPTSLLQLPGNFWVAQLMAVSSKEFLEEYATEHKLRGLSAARVASGERLFYILILGIYENKSLAEQAIADLPPPYDKYNPFLRSLKSLQQAMKRADDIAGSAEF